MTEKHNLEIKILGIRAAQRYVVKRATQSVVDELVSEYPDLIVRIVEVKDFHEIEHYTSILIYPSLVINQKVFCNGFIPSRTDVKNWIKEMLGEELFRVS